jgi:hypothetical protein
MANRVELMGSCIVIESVCGERGGGILLGLHGVSVRTEKENFFFLFPNDREIPTGFSLCFLKVVLDAKYR